MNLSFEDVLSVLGVESQGKSSCIARCPAHDDKTPSLKVSKGEGDKVLFHCYAGCSYESIIEKIGGYRARPAEMQIVGKSVHPTSCVDLSSSDIEFLTTDRMLSKEIIQWAGLRKNFDRVVIPIFDELNNLVDERKYLPTNLRSENAPKMLGRQGSKKCLYPMSLLVHEEGNSDIVSRLDSDKLILVEGELDALAMISNGFYALTNTGGAGSWSDGFSETIVGLCKPVIILLDNDNAGSSGADLRYKSLLKLGAQVSVARWPSSRSAGHDVIDEIRDYGIRELRGILDDSKFKRLVVSLDKVTSGSINWLIQPIIPRGKITILEGDPGIGKSYLALYFAAKISNENHFKTLIFNFEDGLADTTKPRLEKLGCKLDLVIAPEEYLPLDEKGLKDLESILTREKPELVILDTLNAVSAGKDANNAKEMRFFLGRIANLASEHQAAFLILRHLNKKTDVGDQYRGAGSIDITGVARSVLQVVADKKDASLCVVNHIKCNISKKSDPFGFRLNDGNLEILDTVDNQQVPAHKREIDHVIEFLTSELLEGPKEATIMAFKAKEKGFSAATVSRAKKEAGIRSKQKKDGQRVYWEWSL